MLLCSSSNRSKLSIKAFTSKLASPCLTAWNSLRLSSTAQKNQEKLKCSNSFSFLVIIILLTLVSHRSEVKQDTYWGIGQPHVIP